MDRKMDVYTPVDNGENHNKLTWKHILRQVFISTAPWSLYFVTGLSFGTPTVMIPQLRKEANSTAAVSDDMASWFSAIHGYSTLPWTFILPILSELYGRKLPFNIAAVVTVFGYIVWCFSTTVTTILISEIIVSVTSSCNMTLCVVIIVEYSSLKYRGILLTIKSATFFWGLWVANTIGTFFHWRNIVYLSVLCSAHSLSSFFWPESPHWLASQGRFEECISSHRLLKGTSEESEEELKQLIISQKKYVDISLSTRKKVYLRERLINFIKVFSYKIVYKPTLLSLTVITMYHLSGKLACSMYAIEILKKITGQESTAYKGMLILDAVTISGMYFGCYLAKILRRRTLLFSSSSFSIVMLFILSLYLYLTKLNYFEDNSIVSIFLLMLFSISISCGPMLLSTSIFAELIPLRYKGSVVIAIAVVNNIILSTVLKISPMIFKTAGLHVGFLLYGISVSICLCILIKYLPETKDKTLTEIEQYFE